jgi:hypothetical protein
MESEHWFTHCGMPEKGKWHSVTDVTFPFLMQSSSLGIVLLEATFPELSSQTQLT